MISHRTAPILVLLLLMFLASGGALFGQIGTGQVTGTVTDPQGASVPGAAVRLVDQATNITAQVTTNASGNYIFVGVRPRMYTLSVEMTGFRTAQVPAFELGVNQTVTQNVTLTLGNLAETVTVVGEAELIQQASAELGTVVNERVVADLPLNGQNFTMLLTLTPGATPVNTAQASQIGEGNDGSTTGIPGSAFTMPSVQGQWNRAVIYYMDGIINTDFRVSTYGLLPNPDLVQEFKVQSHNDKVEFGGVTGGVVNLVTKSGTNSFHGSGFFFYRDDALDARDPFKDATSKAPAPFSQKQFGATLGGPIIKDRTFFSAGYDGWRYSRPSQAFSYRPTDAELNGDFSNSRINHIIYDPTTTATDAGGLLTRTPFSGNRIPTSKISAMTQGFFKAYSEVPNLTGDPQYNFRIDNPLTNNANNLQIKVDHRLGDKDNLFFRYSRMKMKKLQPSGEKASSLSDVTSYNYGGGWVHVFRPNLILDFRGGTNDRYFDDKTESSVGLGPMKELGFTDVDRFHGMSLGLLTPWTGAGFGGPQPRSNPVWNLAANLSWIKGNHSLKAGYQWINVERLQIGVGSTFSFNNDVTGNPQDLANTGASLASALMGLPYRFSGTLPEEGKVNFALGTWSAYVQDEWRVSPSVTVNFGTRFDYVTRARLYQKSGQAGQDLDKGVYLFGGDSLPKSCAEAQNVVPCVPGGGLSAMPFGDKVVLADNNVFVPTPTWNNWGPRASIAWRVEPKTVVRAGYGLFWDAISARTQYTQHNSEFRWPWASGFAGTANATGDPLKYIQNIQGTFPAVLPDATPWSFVGWTNDPDRGDSYSHQWNVEIQRQMTDNLMMSVAYVGSINRGLDYNALGNSAKSPSPPTATKAQVDAKRPVPFMGGGLFYSRSIGESSYNSFQFKADRRFTNGLQFLVAYTWSKSIDTGSSGWFGAEDGASGSSIQNYHDPKSNRSVSAYNIPHFLSISSIYELPLGKGKPFANSGPITWLVGGWQANTIVQARSGRPYNLQVTGDVANIGNDVAWWSYARPNLVGNPRVDHPTVAQAYNVAAFAKPSGSYGNFGRNVLSTAHAFNTDFSLFKSFAINEQHQLQLRFEFFNIFNVINYGVPGITVDDPGAGRISSVDMPPREIQLGVKYNF